MPEILKNHNHTNTNNPSNVRKTSFVVPTAFIKKFTPFELSQIKSVFATFDSDGNGKIDEIELKNVLQQLGELCNNERIKEIFQETDMDGNGTIEFVEFLNVLDRMRSNSSFTNTVKKIQTINTLKGEAGAMHSYSAEETAAFTEHINNCLRGDPHLKNELPLNSHSPDALFNGVKNGVLLCKLINQAVPETIDERAMNFSKNDIKLSVYKQTENHNLAINAARGIGCTVVNVGAQDLIDGKPILILGLVWQIVKIQLLSQITLKHHPELVRLLRDSEEMSDLMKLLPEQLLLRWINFHLATSGHTKTVSNFSEDISDSIAYLHLLQQIAPECIDMSTAVSCKDSFARAQLIIKSAQRLKVETFIQPNDIVHGNKKLNLAFVAQLFNIRHGLTITEKELYDMAGMLEDDLGDSREERSFRMWINSLNINELYVNNLFVDLQDGVGILHVMDKIEPGIVSWRKVNREPKSRFKKVENCNYCVVLGKLLKFSLVNVGGLDIVDGNKKLILALMWQLMRHHILRILSSISEKKSSLITDEDIVSWANKKVKSARKNSSMLSCRDKTLSSGIFLIDLCSAIEPRAVNWELVTEGITKKQQENNAKYAISISRKIGAVVFLTSEDIVEVQSKMILTLIASLMATCMNKGNA